MSGVRTVRILAALAAASAAALGIRALLARAQGADRETPTAMDHWPPVPRKPGPAA